MAAVLPKIQPAFKVAASGPSSRNGRTYHSANHGSPKNPWEKYRLKLVPKRINGKWYKPGSWVYRKWVMTPGGGYWKYGDDFDFMRGR
jgi:hypothetical protein